MFPAMKDLTHLVQDVPRACGSGLFELANLLETIPPKLGTGTFASYR
ncbi:hypothetical protein J3A64_003254 [Pseudarthrobacter sp. PvP004]|nr:hypothetical protein [Pseudarthrobacter sp. PvP004]